MWEGRTSKEVVNEETGELSASEKDEYHSKEAVDELDKGSLNDDMEKDVANEISVVMGMDGALRYAFGMHQICKQRYTKQTSNHRSLLTSDEIDAGEKRVTHKARRRRASLSKG